MIVSRRWLEALLGKPLEGQDVADRLARRSPPSTALCRSIRICATWSSRACSSEAASQCRSPHALHVDAGGVAPLEVVCGASNVQAGKTYPFAPVGATLPGGLKLERRKIRGVESNGMLCSAKELGLGVDHAGILELDTQAPPGTPFLEAVPIADEQIIIDVSANRPDLLCHKGVARELAVGLGATVKLPEIPGGSAVQRLGGLKHASRTAQPPNRSTAKVDGVEVRLEDPEGAPRYMIAVVRGVNSGSQSRMAGRTPPGHRPTLHQQHRRRHETNILFEVNQPLHAFDLAKLRGPAVVVRRAKPNEANRHTRWRHQKNDARDDGDLRRRAADDCRRGDGKTDSEVSEATTDIVLECAYFQPTRIRRTRRALGLSSESSYRFERGLDMLGMPDALTRAIDLIRAIAGGEMREPPVDLWPEPQQPRAVFLRERGSVAARVCPCLGKRSKRLLSAVASSPRQGRPSGGAGPGWRPDVTAKST